jgi:hypothetical protein
VAIKDNGIPVNAPVFSKEKLERKGFAFSRTGTESSRCFSKTNYRAGIAK